MPLKTCKLFRVIAHCETDSAHDLQPGLSKEQLRSLRDNLAKGERFDLPLLHKFAYFAPTLTPLTAAACTRFCQPIRVVTDFGTQQLFPLAGGTEFNSQRGAYFSYRRFETVSALVSQKCLL
jgi:hypothetical protein